MDSVCFQNPVDDDFDFELLLRCGDEYDECERAFAQALNSGVERILNECNCDVGPTANFSSDEDPREIIKNDSELSVCSFRENREVRSNLLSLDNGYNRASDYYNLFRKVSHRCVKAYCVSAINLLEPFFTCNF